jgi:hypothetical protein
VLWETEVILNGWVVFHAKVIWVMEFRAAAFRMDANIGNMSCCWTMHGLVSTGRAAFWMISYYTYHRALRMMLLHNVIYHTQEKGT